MDEISGWLLDLYDDGENGLALWLITEDDERICLHQPFPVRFYVAGPTTRLRELWRWLMARSKPPKLTREQRRDLFQPQPIIVMAVEARNPDELHNLFTETEQAFPELVYYDADVQVQTRHAAAFGSFPLGRCRVKVDAHGIVQSFEAVDSPWEINPEPPPLRVLEINLPGCYLFHANPTTLELRCGSWSKTLPFLDGETPAFWVKSALKKFDPDIVVTDYGDTWLLEELLQRVKNDPARLRFGRDPARTIHKLRKRTYFSYGQIVYRGQQIHLYGRIHIDRKNAMLWNDYQLEGALESARVTALPIQTAARVSPGSGISCMQMITALRSGVLIPWRKQQAEAPRPLLDLVHADFGGLIYQPTIGLHRDVGAIDFVSMYPAVMIRCDISPEKPLRSLDDAPSEEPGLVPRTLKPLLDKRVKLKQLALELPGWNPRREWYKARAMAAKWLLVVCFGYLGYRNARFGLIGSHEAVTAGGREALLRAKEAAEDHGFEILHMYVDGLWVQKPGAIQPDDFQELLNAVVERTGLPIALDGIYRWVAFLPSRTNGNVPVGNRYFGVFQDGSIKVRGLEARRRDTPAWVAETQMAMIEHLALAPDIDALRGYVLGAIDLVRDALRKLRNGEIELDRLVVAQRLTREPEKYTTPSPSAQAAMQLAEIGYRAEPGQRVRFIFTRGFPRVLAWDLPGPLEPDWVDVARYARLMLRAGSAVLQPLGIDERELAGRLAGGVQMELGMRCAPQRTR